MRVKGFILKGSILRCCVILAGLFCGMPNLRAQPNFDISILSQDTPDEKPKSIVFETTAYKLSVAGTVLPLFIGIPITLDNHADSSHVGSLILISGLGVGPSLGQFYAGSYVAGVLCMLGRSVGAGLILNDKWEATGATLFAASEIYTLIDTHYAVIRNNNRVRPHQTRRFNWSPELSMVRNRELHVGALTWMNF